MSASQVLTPGRVRTDGFGAPYGAPEQSRCFLDDVTRGGGQLAWLLLADGAQCVDGLDEVFAASADHDANHLVVDGMAGQHRRQLSDHPPGLGAPAGVSTSPPADQASTPLSSREESCERIFTIGHSTHPIDEFVRMLTAHGVEQVVDVRTIARSRHNPQFGEDELSERLPASGIGYGRLEALGGLRHTVRDSQNGAWKNASFRGYADYMQTPAFAAGLDRLIEWGALTSVAMMCAEALPWRCHRSLIGDALLVRGIDVQDIMSQTLIREHTLTRFARVEGSRITYPA